MGVIIRENIIIDKKSYVPMDPWISPDKTLGFIMSPKVGSSTMSRVLSHENNWDRGDPDSKCKVFGLVRHPFSRWVSGTAEHWCPDLTRNNNNIDILYTIDFQTLLDDSFYDRHTAPQIWNFIKYPTIRLFRLENLHKIWKYLNIPENKVHERNNLTMGGLQIDIRKVIEHRAQPFKNKIATLFKEDMKLWIGAE